MADNHDQQNPVSDNTSPGCSIEVPVVGIGASAGGIQAIKAFLNNAPPDSELSLVIIQHKQPKPEHTMQNMYENITSIPVKTIEDGMELESNHIYLNPGGKNVKLKRGRFSVSETTSSSEPMTVINTFFESLASQQQEKAIGIILSGSGSDGTTGLRSIKNEGGMTMVQDPSSAQYRSMPESALKATMADFILKPGDMPQKLLDYIEHPYVNQIKKDTEQGTYKEFDLQAILSVIKEGTGHDFSGYKRETILRRLKRRLAINQIEEFDRYLDYLQKHPGEVDALFYEILVDVTEFFRDYEAFDYLENEVAPDLIRNCPPDEEIRIWDIGCSTGQEVYSLAILFKEVMETLSTYVELKIFATDIDTRALNVAREAIYPKNILPKLGEERINKYFLETENGYQVKSSIRNRVIFAEHNVLSDPPYSNIDFVSCRNLLIYLGKENQEKVLRSIHYALSHQGYLFTGPSESVNGGSQLFSTENLKWKVFRKKGESSGLGDLPVDFSLQRQTEVPDDFENDQVISPHLLESAQQTLYEEFGPPALLLDEAHNIVQLFGNTDKYLTHRPGKVSFNVLEMTPDPLKNKLMLLLNEVSDSGEPETEKEVMLERDDGLLVFNVTVSPISAEGETRNYYLVVFHEKQSGESPLPEEEFDVVEDEEIDPREYRKLKRELDSTKQYLHQTIQQLESKNKELQQKNNELQSLNEEYQSTNEELVTSQEELQSTNEELVTVNEKLEEKVEQLTKLNDDMNNLLRAIDLPVIFLDRSLNIKRFTPAVKETFNLIDSDVGRPLSDITTNFSETDFLDNSRDVLDSLQPKQFEIQDDNDRWFNVRILPYRTESDVIEGVVITLNDITEFKKFGKMHRLATVLKDSSDAIILFNFDGVITDWNQGASNIYGYEEDEALGKDIRMLLPEGNKGEIDELIHQVRTEGPVKSYRTTRINRNGERIEIWMTATGYVNGDGDVEEIATTERDLNWLPTDGQ